MRDVAVLILLAIFVLGCALGGFAISPAAGFYSTGGAALVVVILLALSDDDTEASR